MTATTEKLPEWTGEANELEQAEGILLSLASVFFQTTPTIPTAPDSLRSPLGITSEENVEARYRTLVEQIPAVVFMAYLDRGIGEAYVSPQIEALLGFTQEEWLNDPVRWYQQIHPDDKGRWSLESARLFVSGEPLRSVYRVLARDGKVIWFHCEAKMVRGDHGRPWFIHGVAFDITELKNAEEALKKSEEMLRGLFEFAPDTVLVANQDGCIVRVNAQVEKMFGYTRDELAGKQIEELIPERFRGVHIQHRSDYQTEAHARPMGAGLELYGKRRDGSEFPVDIMLSPMKSEEGSIVIAVIRDITRRKQSEEALKEYAERLSVLSRRLMDVQETERRNIARELHDEISQALTGLKLTLEMAARQSPDEVGASIYRAHALVNELMAHARKMSLDLRPPMLDDLGLLPALLWQMEHYTAQTGVRVDFRYSGIEARRFEPEVETAGYRIVQEALTNVARHSEVDDVTVRVWTQQSRLMVEIEDSGVGFNPEAVLVASDTSGLAGMRERAKLLGGELLVDSQPGGGTRVTAELSFSASLDG
jgi:PAS domain S-box-containing protein